MHWLVAYRVTQAHAIRVIPGRPSGKGGNPGLERNGLGSVGARPQQRQPAVRHLGGPQVQQQVPPQGAGLGVVHLLDHGAAPYLRVLRGAADVVDLGDGDACRGEQAGLVRAGVFGEGRVEGGDQAGAVRAVAPAHTNRAMPAHPGQPQA
jgi:hypothetical protein